MIWTCRFTVLAVLIMVYGAGLAGGREYCEARHQHPVLYPNNKP